MKRFEGRWLSAGISRGKWSAVSRETNNKESISFSGRAVLKGISLPPGSGDSFFFAGMPVKEGAAALDKEAEKWRERPGGKKQQAVSPLHGGNGLVGVGVWKRRRTRRPLPFPLMAVRLSPPLDGGERKETGGQETASSQSLSVITADRCHRPRQGRFFKKRSETLAAHVF